MKKIRMTTKAALLLKAGLLTACLALTLAGCQNPAPDRIDPGAGRGTLDLTIGSPAGRTIQPEVGLGDFAHFDLNFFKLANEDAEVGTTPYPSITWEDGETAGPIILDAGHWELQVTAFLPGEGGGDPLPAADGSIRFYLAAGASTSRDVPLAPIAAGYGTFAWDLTLSGGVTLSAVAVTAIDAAGNTTGSALSATADELVAAGMRLAAGRYDAVFTLSLDGDSISVSSVLYVYQNMTSTFRRSFSSANFAQSLIDYILGLWNETYAEWNFAIAGITWEHFYYLLEIEGITGGNFNEVTALFNELAYDFEAPTNLEGLKAMTDAALITLGADAAFLAAVYANRGAAQTAITALTANETPLGFDWTSYRAVTVTVGAYEVPVEFANDIVDANFSVSSEAEWNAAVAAINAGGNDMEYTIAVTGNFSVAGRAMETFTPTGLTVTIQGDYTISLSGSGSLLNVGAEQNIILQDTNLEGRSDNNVSLVVVSGTFAMQGNSEIRGNTASWGGGVDVFNGIFTMQDNASVHSNTVSEGGGGVDVWGGTFTMWDNASVRNNTAGDSGGVRVGNNGIFTMQDNSSVHDNTTTIGNSGGVQVGIGGGTFTMQDNASVHGNTASVSGGGVQVQSGGIFTMQDNSSVHDNTATSWGGGVLAFAGGTFRISGGVVYGNNEGNMSNNATHGAALLLSGGTAQRGIFEGDTFFPLGSLVTTDNTIRVVDGNRVGAAEVTVSFDTSGGQPATIAPVTIFSGEILGWQQFPPAPTREDFVFVGWFNVNDTAFVTPITATTVINQDISLIARWFIALPAPTLSITGSVVSWTEVAEADGYRLYAGTTLIAALSATITSVDLETASVGIGNHSITVVAVSDDPAFGNSPPSNAVNFVVVENSAWRTVWESPFISNRGGVTVSPTAAGLVVANRGTGEHDHNNGLAVDIIGLRTLYVAITGADIPTITITGTAPPGSVPPDIVPPDMYWRFDFQGTEMFSFILDNSFTFSIDADVYIAPPSWGSSPFPFIGTAPDLHFNYTITGIQVGSMSIYELLLAFEPVTGITGVDTSAIIAGTSWILSGTVVPATATNQTIVWSVVSGPGNITAGNVLNATGITAGTIAVRATIVNGVDIGVDYWQDFTITVDSAGLVFGFEEFRNMAPEITIPNISLRVPQTITVDDPDDLFESIRWFVGERLVGQYASLTIDRVIHNNQTGTHAVTVEVVTMDGSLYSRAFRFTVTP